MSIKQKPSNLKEDLTRLLAEETLLHILKELPVRTLFAAGQVDQRWRRVSRDERLWRDARLGGDQLGCKTRNAVRNIACVLRMAPCLRALSLDNSFCGRRMLRAVRESQCKIRELDLQYCESEPWFYELLARQSRGLVKLSLSEITYRVVPVLESMGQLQHLSYRSSYFVHTAPSAESKLRNLVSLRMDANGIFGNKLLEDNGLTLQELSVSNMFSGTPAALIKSCKHLNKLEVIRFVLDGSALIRLKDLVSLHELVLHVDLNDCWFSIHPYYFRLLPTQIHFLTVEFAQSYGGKTPLAHCEALLEGLPAVVDLERVVLVFEKWDRVPVNIRAALQRAVPPGAECLFVPTL